MRWFVLMMVPALLRAGDVRVSDAWIRAVPPSSHATAAFMVIENTGTSPVWLTSAKAAFAEDVRPMITTVRRENGAEVAGMEFVDRFEIAPGAKRVLQPGGDHIMLMKLREVPAKGSSREVILNFSVDGRSVEETVKADVR